MRRGMPPPNRGGRGRDVSPNRATNVAADSATSGRMHSDNEGWGLTTTQTEQDTIEEEHAAYFERRNVQRRVRSERSRREFDQIAAHADDERKRQRSAFDSNVVDGEDENADAATLAARRAVMEMSEEEKEAALARHEERQARSKYAVDYNPERLHLKPYVRKKLEKAVMDMQLARARVNQQKQQSRSDEDDDNDGRMSKKVRGNSINVRPYSTSYFQGRDDGVGNTNGESKRLYKDIVSERMSTPTYQRFLEARQKLPALKLSTTIADVLLDTKISTAVVSGEMGATRVIQSRPPA